METAEQVRPLIAPDAAIRLCGPMVIGSLPIIEAFPNAFLAVMLPDECFSEPPLPRKRKRFDWLYDRAVSNRVFPRLLDHLGWDCPPMLERLSSESDHEKRAALICVLTAATAAAGEAIPIGNQLGGYLWMPPKELWSGWARAAMETLRP
jgi:hypothetical protein